MKQHIRMGIDVKGITTIGVRFAEADLYTKVLVRTHGEHDHVNNAKFKYCPECGRENWTQQQACLIPIIEDHFKQWEVCRAWVHNEEPYLYICIYRGTRNGPRSYQQLDNIKCPYSFTELDRLKMELKSHLEKYKLWDENKFGIYTLVEYSC